MLNPALAQEVESMRRSVSLNTSRGSIAPVHSTLGYSYATVIAGRPSFAPRFGSLLDRAIRRCGYDREQFVLWNVAEILRGCAIQLEAALSGRGEAHDCSVLARTYPHGAQLEYFRTSGFVLAGDTEVIAWQLRQEWQSFRVAELAILLETAAHFFGKHLVSV
jgi:hypothetical protein